MKFGNFFIIPKLVFENKMCVIFKKITGKNTFFCLLFINKIYLHIPNIFINFVLINNIYTDI